MKKFYTLLSVALAGTMMVSAGVRTTDAKPAAALEAKTFNTVTFDATPSQVVKKEVARKAPAKAEAAEETSINGEYLFKAYARNFDNDGMPGAYWMNESVPYIEVAEDNSVIIEGFWDATFNLEGTYDPEAATITIPYTQKVTVPTQSGSLDLNVYVIDFATKTPHDLVLVVDAANRNLTWTPADNGQSYLETLLIGTYGYTDGSKIYDQMYDCALNEINAIMDWAALDANGDPIYDAEGNIETESAYVYAYRNGTDLYVENLCDFSPYTGYEGCFGLPVVFAIDKEAQTITASNQYLPFPNGATELPFYVCGVEGDQFNYDNPSVTFVGDEMELSSGMNITAFYTDAVGILGIVGDKVYGADYYEVELLLLEPLFTNMEGESGIADVIANDNSNAPVEYFNLQGVKVENPAAGLYIRRQGNQATKVLVK